MTDFVHVESKAVAIQEAAISCCNAVPNYCYAACAVNFVSYFTTLSINLTIVCLIFTA